MKTTQETINVLAVSLVVIAGIAKATAQEVYRSIDGSGNHQSQPWMGMQGSLLGRLAPANYHDGVSTVDPSLPNPREVSNAIFPQGGSVPDTRNLSEWVWVWGQLIDHDISHTLTSPGSGSLSIPIPADDPWFGSLPPGSAIQVTRALHDPLTGLAGPPAVAREHPNNISAWLDAGMVYGGRAIDGPSSVDRATWLREPSDTAKLRTSDGGSLGSLLPKYDHGTSPMMANTGMPGMTSSGGAIGDLAFVAGDVRANENTSLLVAHTIFVREHNRVVDVLRAVEPSMNEDTLYERARKIVGAQVQSITYHEFLPALGVHLEPYGGYDENLYVDVFTEFSTAAFRLAHSQINSFQLRLDADGNTIPAGNITLADAFFNPGLLYEGGLDPLIRGLAKQVQEANDTLMVDALRNQLFQGFIPAFGLVEGATDLAAVDILRGRDMGLPGYNAVRLAMGFAAVSEFSEMTSNGDLATALASLYSSTDEVDLWLAMLVEDPLTGAQMGETATRLYEIQFELLRDGDRFWYENDLDGINSDLLMLANWGGEGEMTAIDWLNTLTLADVLRLNSEVGDSIQDQVFFVQPIPEPSGLVLVLLSGMALAFRRSRGSASHSGRANFFL